MSHPNVHMLLQCRFFITQLQDFLLTGIPYSLPHVEVFTFIASANLFIARPATLSLRKSTFFSMSYLLLKASNRQFLAL